MIGIQVEIECKLFQKEFNDIIPVKKKIREDNQTVVFVAEEKRLKTTPGDALFSSGRKVIGINPEYSPFKDSAKINRF
ncbi:hypothetical protein JTE90_027608 [Oedothorax gibbosus]|uniref:Uncharacterized protein n=1 Tax=Oedothorax gibbosus TaxID=931172 RepID=A0AAV6VMY3_9ARAC|nr:hypothetical protein JTE90_027608 [Oedothorax gibbosus]